MDPKLAAFQEAVLIRNVVARFVEGKVFPTQDALDAYLKDHPSADKSKHRVENDKDREDSAKKKHDKDWAYLRKKIKPEHLRHETDADKVKKQRDDWDAVRKHIKPEHLKRA